MDLVIAQGIVNLLAVALLSIASITDLKTREVPDLISYCLLFGALGLRIIFSISIGWQYFISGLLGFVLFFIIGVIFFYTDQWGGADTKLLMGMGWVIGADFIFSIQGIAAWRLITFFLALLFVGASYSTLWSMVLAIKNAKVFYKQMTKLLREFKKWAIISTATTFILLVLSIRSLLLIPIALFPLATFMIIIFISSVEQSCFIKEYTINKLRPGDWLAKNIHLNGKHILDKKALEYKDIALLKKLELQGEINSVTVKEGIPFIPSFLLSFLLVLFGQGIITAITSLF